jgi:hypothetical protein
MGVHRMKMSSTGYNQKTKILRMKILTMKILTTKTNTLHPGRRDNQVHTMDEGMSNLSLNHAASKFDTEV